jgi:hypothetical protein
MLLKRCYFVKIMNVSHAGFFSVKQVQEHRPEGLPKEEMHDSTYL